MKKFVGKYWFSFAYYYYSALQNWIIESVVQLQSVALISISYGNCTLEISMFLISLSLTKLAQYLLVWTKQSEV